MTLPGVWWSLLALAAALVGIAVWAGPNLAIAAPAATGAAVVAVVLLVAGWDRRARPRATGPNARSARPSEVPFRAAFAYGRMGREEVVLTLDRIERAGTTPNLPSRSAEELEALVARPPREFAEYVEGRIADLEARS